MVVYDLKMKNENKGNVVLTVTKKQNNNSLKTDKFMTAIPPYIVCIFVFTVLIHYEQ